MSGRVPGRPGTRQDEAGLTRKFCTGRQILYHCATYEAQLGGYLVLSAQKDLSEEMALRLGQIPAGGWARAGGPIHVPTLPGVLPRPGCPAERRAAGPGPLAPRVCRASQQGWQPAGEWRAACIGRELAWPCPRCPVQELREKLNVLPPQPTLIESPERPRDVDIAIVPFHRGEDQS